MEISHISAASLFGTGKIISILDEGSTVAAGVYTEFVGKIRPNGF